jgi:hypothetical protein
MGPTAKRDGKDDGALGTEQRGRSPSASEPNAGSLHEGPLPTNGRWSTRRKAEVVIRILRGEPMDALSPRAGRRGVPPGGVAGQGPLRHGGGLEGARVRSVEAGAGPRPQESGRALHKERAPREGKGDRDPPPFTQEGAEALSETTQTTGSSCASWTA